MRQTVLIVGGEPEERISLGRSLSEDGFIVEISADAYEALQKVRESRYDIAVVNLDSPLMQEVRVTACDLARVFRSMNPGISVVYLGARAKQGPGARPLVTRPPSA